MDVKDTEHSALERNNELLASQLKLQSDWRVPLRNGFISGVGTVIGATLTVWLAVTLIKPFQNIEALKPTLERLTQALERDQRR